MKIITKLLFRKVKIKPDQTQGERSAARAHLGAAQDRLKRLQREIDNSVKIEKTQ